MLHEKFIEYSCFGRLDWKMCKLAEKKMNILCTACYFFRALLVAVSSTLLLLSHQTIWVIHVNNVLWGICVCVCARNCVCDELINYLDGSTSISISIWELWMQWKPKPKTRYQFFPLSKTSLWSGWWSQNRVRNCFFSYVDSFYWKHVTQWSFKNSIYNIYMPMWIYKNWAQMESLHEKRILPSEN